MLERGSSFKRTLLAYSAMLLATIAGFQAIRWAGERIVAPPGVAPDPSSAPSASNETFLHVLLALIVVIVCARALGAAFRWIHQPPVIGEVLAGIALGPSLLGRVWPAASSFILPSAVAPFLSVIAQVGVVLFMFLVGLELDTGRLRERTHSTVAISHASITVPFVLGALLALWLYPRFSSSSVPFTVFALFIGISLSITAFPVLARILTDRGIQKTRLGVQALTCAAADDVTAWCLLAFIVSVAKARASSALVTVGLAAAYVGVMLFVVRPLFARLVRKQELRKDLPQQSIALVFVSLLASALATEAIGIHAIFGAFMLGAIVPHESMLAREITRRLEDIVVVLLLPAFFAFTGMRTQISLLSDATLWLICGGIIVVASIGKFGGTFVAARLTGLPSREAASLGILMNTRGLMELIVLNLGLDLRVITPTIFAMLVVMAIVTTFATTPILHWLQQSAKPARLADHASA